MVVGLFILLAMAVFACEMQKRSIRRLEAQVAMSDKQLVDLDLSELEWERQKLDGLEDDYLPPPPSAARQRNELP